MKYETTEVYNQKQATLDFIQRFFHRTRETSENEFPTPFNSESRLNNLSVIRKGADYTSE